MRTLTAFFLLMIINKASGQIHYPLEDYTTDTIQLKEFVAKKVVGYKTESATFFVSYQEYLYEHHRIWKIYNENMKGSHTIGQEIIYEVLDSTYKILIDKVSTQDTINFTHNTFDRVGLTYIMDFGRLIDSSKCAVFDLKNSRQYLIVRQRGIYMKEFDDGWKGRKYFFPGMNKEFFEGVDAIY